MIESLVAQLPEVYQPIFGHSDFADHASRPCADRLEVILGVYDALQNLMGRPLRVLDLGCAQGYFSLNLASRGASVLGVDFLDKNVAVCTALAEENPQFDATFEVGRVEDVIDRLQPGQYDLILGLSVFHHVIHERGIDEVKRLFQHAASVSGALILEIALQEGDLFWAASQPENPRSLLESLNFVREVVRCKTHLTNVERPLYVASNCYWVIGDKAGEFDTWSDESHALANNTHEGSRRYFFGPKEIAKLYRFEGAREEHNRLEFLREKMFLSNPPPGYPVAQSLVVLEGEQEGWIVMERFSGSLLLEVLTEPTLDRKAILRDILDQLVILESFGLCHSDIRSWNILVSGTSQARLIDYGAISQEFKDCVWPHNVYLAFLVFVHELATGHVVDPSPIRQVSITPFNLPQPFRSWAARMWALPLQEWSFRLMLEHLDVLVEDPLDGNPEKTEEFWMQAIEEAIDLHSERIRDLGGQFLGKSQDMELQLDRVRSRVELVAEIARDVQGEMKETERRAIYVEAVAEQLRLQLQEAGLRVQSAERRSHDTELSLRESINRAAQAEMKRSAAEYANDLLREQSLQATSELLDLYKSHQKLTGQFEFEQQQRLSLEAKIEGLQARASELEAERDAIRVESIGALAQIEHQRLDGAASDAHIWYQKTEAIKASQEEMRKSLDEALANAHHWYSQAMANEKLVSQLRSSTSWRITWPMRAITRVLRWMFILPVRALKLVTRKGMAFLIRFLLDVPVLRRPASALLKRYPRIHAHLLQFARHRGLIRADMTPSISTPFHAPQKKTSPDPTLLSDSPIEKSQLLDFVDKDYYGKKVAVLAPVSSSGIAGGAERFNSGLVKALIEQGCNAELVCLPVDESTFEGIQQGYRDFAALDLSAYHLVISTKAPSYAANHPNHVLYLVHTVRVFYDMFADVFPHASESVTAQQNWIIQEDNKAFAQIKNRFSIGTEVSKRLVEWNNYDAEVIHPPMDIDGLYNAGTGDYFFMPGRLHAWKRVDLAIKAIKCSSLPMKLVISGMGDAEQQLRELAAGDSRIEFRGRVDDDTLKRLYAGALAVPFLPIREDYGYITLEAFASGKPVITCTDSGEPQVFVEHGISGFVCAPEPQSVCAAFERLWGDHTMAARMGNAGRERVSSINWKTVSNRLLRAGFPEIKSPVLKIKTPLKVAVLDMQPIIPAVGGGRLRLLGLYHALGEDVQARYIGSYDWPGEKYRRHSISSTFEEIDVPLSAEHHAAAAESARQAGGKTVIDMLFPLQGHLSPEYLQEVFDAVEWAEVVIFSHPWIAPLVSDARLVGKTVIYDSQNVESELRSQLLDLSSPFEKSVLDEVIRAEKLVGDRADIVLACSQEDIDGFVARFGWRASKLKLVPNGVFSDVIQPPTPQQKTSSRQALGLASDEKVAFFIGSNYAPNIEAGLFIVEELAQKHPDCLFVIGGGVCSKLAQKLPENVRSIGFLEEEDKVRWLHASDLAINPMFSGSGTNIKMFDFMSAGLPVVTTPTGARGITSTSTEGIYLAEREDVSALLARVLNDQEALVGGGKKNRRVVKDRFSWEAISPELGATVRTAHTRKQGVALLSSAEKTTDLRVAHLSTVGLKCGIGEYTRKLIEVYKERGISNFLLAAEAANEKPTLSDLDVPVDIVWFFDNVTWNTSRIEPQALQRLLEWNATHLIIQYHPGYYPAEMLIDFAKTAKRNGVVVTVIVHNFVDETAAVMRRLNSLNVTLFSHRTTEVFQAKALGVQLEKVPLAMEFREEADAKSQTSRDWTAQPPVIVTTGFLRRHKGVVSLIRSMPKVLEKFPGVQLVVQCALYPSEDSERELLACESEIKQLKLTDVVRLDTRFLDKEVVLDELAKADLAVLPYEQSNEGGSATAADCMCVGLPLIVSDAEIFDEVRAVAFTVQPNVKAISAGIIEVLSNPDLYIALKQNSIAHAQENSWGNFAGGFLLE